MHNRGKTNTETDKEGKGKQRIKQKRKTIRSLKSKQKVSNVPWNVFPISDIAALSGITLAQ